MLVALASQTTSQLKAFSIGFESINNEQGDEFYYSDLIAKTFNTQHYRLFVTNNQLIDSLAECVRAMSEPMPSHDNIGFYLLAKEVAQYVKVVLSGQGADEMFAGYNSIQKLAVVPENEDALVAYRRYFFDLSYKEYCTTVTQDWCTHDLSSYFIYAAFRANGARNLVDNAMQIDATFALANGPLQRVDNMAMASSLEARVPFLDEIVVNLASAMPLRYKLPDGGKAILKQLGRRLLPQAVVDRPKGYFPVPILKYLQGPVLDLLQDVLSERRVLERGIFNPETVKKLLKKPEEHLTPLGASKLWQIGLLEFWLQQQGI